jgi:hypothetical protein
MPLVSLTGVGSNWCGREPGKKQRYWHDDTFDDTFDDIGGKETDK